MEKPKYGLPRVNRENQMIPINEMLSQVKISWINWESPDLKPLNVGGYSVIYQVVPGLIAKAGLIEPEVVSAQHALAQRGLALPILDYEAVVATSQQVQQAVCSEHGIRLVVPNGCRCDSPLSVLLMPEAEKTHHKTNTQPKRVYQRPKIYSS
jgi:hypothetical protein